MKGIYIKTAFFLKIMHRFGPGHCLKTSTNTYSKSALARPFHSQKKSLTSEREHKTPTNGKGISVFKRTLEKLQERIIFTEKVTRVFHLWVPVCAEAASKLYIHNINNLQTPYTVQPRQTPPWTKASVGFVCLLDKGMTRPYFMYL